MHTIAAIAVALHEAATPEFRDYANQILANASAMADEFIQRGYIVTTGGTDNHMVILDFTSQPYDGRDAEKALEAIGISASKSTIPNDPNPPFRPSGLRIGMPAMTTRGVDESATRQIVEFIDRALCARDDIAALDTLRAEVERFCQDYPLPHI
jgi:glycine hydroxymethyltransferase